MSRAGVSRNPIERVIRALRGQFPPVYLICHCSLSVFSFFLYLLRAFLLFNIKGSKKEEEEIEEMTKQVYEGKQPPETPCNPFSLPLAPPAVAFR